MAFWQNQPALTCLGSTTISALVGYLLLRPFRREQLARRLPLFLVTGGTFFFIAVLELPETAPYLFEQCLGHSLNEMVIRRLGNGVTMGENWLTLWGESVAAAFRYVIIASMIWAIVNLFRRDAVRTNILTLVLSLGWAWVYLWASLARLPL
jgi:hypothetical protein